MNSIQIFPNCLECESKLTLDEINSFDGYCEYCWNALMWANILNHTLPETDYDNDE